ncbi:MAG: hypothetical protein LBC99_10960 [Spirochaetota bacterium]|jgi:hypothetical protein|nr:hypothetical protein [Spirochaetota bacterium]
MKKMLAALVLLAVCTGTGFAQEARKSYYALELSASEYFFINIGVKLGSEKVYGNIIASYDPREGYSPQNFGIGAGIGTIRPITAFLFFNPEFNAFLMNTGPNNQSLMCVITSLGCNLGKNLSLTAGPELAWSWNYGSDPLRKPAYSLAIWNIDNGSDLVLGARASLRYRF